MLIIRLQRVGRTNDPSFRVIVTDSKRAAKTGSVLEIVGNYDARQGKPQLDADRIQHWIKNGAQVSDTVHNLLVKNKIIDGKTIHTVPVKPVQPEKAEEAVVEAAPVKAEEPVTASEDASSETAESAPEEIVAFEEPTVAEEPKDEPAS